MTAIDRVDPAITVFFKVRSSDTIVSIPENMIVAAVIKNTDPITERGIPDRIYANLGHTLYSRKKTAATIVTMREQTPVAEIMPIFWV